MQAGMLLLGIFFIVACTDVLLLCKADVGSNEDDLGGDPEGGFFKSLGLFDTINGSSEGSGIRWKYGIVPYRVNMRHYDPPLARQVQSVLRYVSTVTCIKFVRIEHKPCTPQWWLHFVNPKSRRDCDARPRFSPGGEIFVVLGYDCLLRRQLLQATLRGLGLTDMVTHPRRSNYINVLYDNVHPDYSSLFDVASDSKFAGVQYSGSSVLHCHEYAYSRNGRPTVVARSGGVNIEPAKDLSQTDITMLHERFSKECNKRYLTKLFDSCKLAMRGDGRRRCSLTAACPDAAGGDRRAALQRSLHADLASGE